MKKFAALMAIIVAVTFSAGIVVGANAPDKVTINHIQKTKEPVVFDHKAHTTRAENCQVCHHKNKKGEEQACQACHKEKAEGKVVGLKDAYHTMCKDCHKKDASKKAPTTCNGCHKK
ncbi:MAG TPA: cytochrome c3 family protein [Candidatus Deferrimicrobiaceae bacterium]|nr:cytochrome c3 family protein [Candidatus Deferrimicrobiaceae bacterium]